MDEEKKHIIYSAEDIQRYLSGKLTPAEMHVMEKAALDDPFLADAMEGFETVKPSDWEPRLVALKNQFAQAQGAKLIPMNTVPRYTTWKMAAAVLVLVTGISIMYMVSSNKQDGNSGIASTKKMEDSIVNRQPENKLPESIIHPAPSEMTTPVPAQKVAPITKPEEQEVVQNDALIYQPPMAAPKQKDTIAGGGYVDDKMMARAKAELALENAVASKQSQEFKKAANQSMANENEMDVPALKKEVPAINRNFSAQVVSPDNSPLPFANINVVSEQVGTYADARGNFRLISSDSTLRIQVKSAGYVPRELVLRSNEGPYKITLFEDEGALKEKMTVSSKTRQEAKKRRAALVPDSVINVEPADGWSNYDTYITNNLSIPDEILQKKIHGEVEISFEVEGNGAITNVKVDKSLCQDCDEAAMRAIKEGPRWKIKKGAKGTGKVKVKF